MGLKILHSADWHLDSPFGGFGEEQRTLLKQEQRSIPGKVAQLCRREKCDLMLLAGDIFDGKADRETVDALKKALADCGARVFIAPGNHDFCAPGSVWLEQSWPENVHVFTGGLEAVTIPELNCRVYGAGYQSMDSAALLESFRAEGSEQYCIAVLHGDPTRKDSPYCPITAQQARDSGLQYLALGHIHKAGAFHAGATLCAWPGCPMGRGWDETGEKGVCIVTLGENASLRAVALDTIRFHELKVDIGSDAGAALEAVLPPAGSRDFFRVTLTGSGEADIPGLKEHFSAIANLELRDETLPPLDIWGDTDADTLEGVYFRLLREAMDADPDSREEIQLAAEISRKLLEGREVTL
ncbi:MAG: exonuclease SbcCD subunit D [Faecousia sp.]